MELYERIDLDRINYLNKMTYSEFKKVCSKSCKNEAERKIKYEMMKKFCEINIKAKGEVRRLYAYTEKTPIEVGGRLYCGNSIQGLSRKIRGFLCKGTTDIDMKNAHPTIIQWLCKLHGIATPMLNFYVEHRDEVCERFGENGKMVFLCALNDERLNKKIKDEFFKKFDKECKIIQKAITALPEYKHIVDSTPNKIYNWTGSAFNRIMCVWENKILQEAITVLNREHIEMAVLMFDGCMVYGNYYNDEELLREIERTVNAKFDGLNMIFTYKPHDNEIELPETAEKYDPETSNEDSYEYLKKEFEKNHAKITDKAIFLKIKEDGDLVIMNTHRIREAYMEDKYTDYTAEKPEKKSFITRWLLDETMRKYSDVGVYPPPRKCPPTVYNLWKPFKVSLYKGDYEKDEEGLKAFINHISILCNREERARDYLIFWLAQMFQYPATKTIAVTLISKEGAGKGTLMLLLALLIGGNKSRVIEIVKPSRDVWGSFNPMMINAFFVNLNEMCKKEAQEAESYIKALITDGTLLINRKGVDPYSVESFHRWLITSNDDEPMKIKKGDRRHFVVKCSNEKIGDIAYFENLNKLWESERTQRTIYDYLMAIPDMENFGKIQRPETEWLRDNKKLREDHMLLWVEQMVLDNIDEYEKRFTGSQQLELYTAWCKKEGHKYDDPNAISLAIGIKRLELPGVQTAVKDGNQNKTVYNIQELKKHFKIGWQGGIV